MLIGRGKGIASSEITSEREYLGRRDFLRAAGIVTGAALLPQSLLACSPGERRTVDSASGAIGAIGGDQLEPTSFEDITTYNNYYEFGTDKTDPSRNSGRFRPKPWSVRVDGLVKKPADYALEDLVKPYKLEDRIYRHRCVEAWSMVIPWQGFPLRDLIAKVQPDPKARFVEFTTVLRPAEMPGQRSRVLPWPYVEALRMDEAMHPLTLLSTGLYGKSLLPQNGAPLRTVIPWKYGFKGTKSIVRIRFTEQQPTTTWNDVAPEEYGFYANVNPAVDHPRWTQSKERVIGGGWRRKETLPFNGYADQVASLYSGMDLRKHF